MPGKAVTVDCSPARLVLGAATKKSVSRFQEVPVLFSDNFDCQTLDEFVKGTLESDLTDHSIYVHAIEDESYAARFDLSVNHLIQPVEETRCVFRLLQRPINGGEKKSLVLQKFQQRELGA